MHAFPWVKRLERSYEGSLVVVGVHSPKFPNEGEPASLREAIARYGLEHPVVNDPDFAIWERYRVQSWPTFILIGPDGVIRWRGSGEGRHDEIRDEIERILREEGDSIRRDPLDLLARPRVPETFLRYPGKIAATDDMLVVSDSGHHRIVVADLDGTVRHVIGAGEPGHADGAFAEARFHNPQGVAIEGRVVFIADTDNHRIRMIDLDAGTVSTVAGTGEMSYDRREGPGTEVGLNSPWDLLVDGRTLYLAMAGNHQIWRMDLESGRVGPFAGSGREDIVDGRLESARLAQPSGLTLLDRFLVFADSESSGIRAVDVQGGMVVTFVGTGLFDFGDRDGRGSEVRLQHPLAVLQVDGAILIADTYNHKIKRLDVSSQRVTTVIGEEAGLREPSGLAWAGGRLYIADTNSHSIRIADLDTGRVTTLDLRVP